MTLKVALVKMFIAAGARLDVGRSIYGAALANGFRPVLRVLLQHGAPLVSVAGLDIKVLRERYAPAWSYHDKLVAAGGYEPYVKKHRILLSSVVDKVVEAKFGRRAPREVCAHVVTFWTPPGGF